MRILYAEDEKALSNAVAEILRMKGYEVAAVYNGLQAWERLNTEYYDAVILDIMMPKLDGIQVLERMRKQEDFTPVLLLTAKSTVEDRIGGLAVGADDYLSKPFDMGELLARIDSMIRRTTKYRVRKLKYGNITLNCDTCELQSERGSLRLSSKEVQILGFFMENAGVLFNLSQIGEWLGKNEDMDHAVILYMSYLRNKLSQLHSDMEIVRIQDSFVLRGVNG